MKAMMRLQDLPEDVLAQILVGPVSSQAIALWMTLNHQMQAKLLNGGVVHLELRSFVFRKEASLTVCLQRFRLQSLKISSTLSPVSPAPAAIRREIRQLWSGLEHLELGGENAMKVFNLHIPAKKPKKYSRKGSKRAKIAEDVEPTPEELLAGDWNMNITHPNLKTLILACPTPFQKGRFPPLDFVNTAFLPRSLTYLDVSRTGWTIYYEDCINLPPQLTTLILPAAPRLALRQDDGGIILDHPKYDVVPAINEHIIESLPHSLTRIDSPSGTGACYTAKALYMLAKAELHILPNLISFPDCENFRLWCQIHDLHGRKWPQNLHEMTFPSGFSLLGPRPDTWSPTIFVFHHLPTTITSLTAESIKWKSHPALGPNESIWPPTLTSLTLTRDSHCYNYFHLLPRNLKRFSLYSDQSRDYIDVLQDPASLMTFGQTILNNIDAEKWVNIKQQLISIRDAELHADARSNLDFYISEVERGALYGLPLTLEYLRYDCRYGKCPISLIPPLVKRAELKCYSDPPHPSHYPLRAIPPHLLDLEWILRDPIVSNGPNGLLSSRVTRLVVETDSEDPLSPFLMNNLPRGVQNLSITYRESYWRPPSITLDNIKNLPQTIQWLRLDATLPSEPNSVPWTSLLPQGLKGLDVLKALDASDYKSLPPSLTILCAPMPVGDLATIDPRPASLLQGKLYGEYERTGERHARPLETFRLSPWTLISGLIKKREELLQSWSSMERERAQEAVRLAANIAVQRASTSNCTSVNAAT